uniref:Uncharacterized protein n=1 Tax=Solanum lycopersicum TaxID=4081 RepID=A0A3Q7HUR7_SOLLC
MEAENHTLGWNTSGLLNSGDQIVFLSICELCLDAPAVDYPDKLAVFNESQNLLILFVKD